MFRSQLILTALFLGLVLGFGALAPAALALPNVPCAVDPDPPHLCADGGAFCRLNDRPGICQSTTLGCACAGGASVSGIYLTQIACDSLGSQDVVTFSVQNLEGFSVCEVHLVPAPQPPSPPDSCRVYAAYAAPGWIQVMGTIVSGPNGVSFYANPGACIPPGGQLAPFQIALTPPGCCYQVVIRDMSGNYLDAGTVCFDCSHPTAAYTRSWGKIKSMYK